MFCIAPVTFHTRHVVIFNSVVTVLLKRIYSKVNIFMDIYMNILSSMLHILHLIITSFIRDLSIFIIRETEILV